MLKVNENDLFEVVAFAIGCEYISDMKFEPYNDIAKKEVARHYCTERFPLKTLNELYEYLYGKARQFDSYDEAKNAFEKK